MYYTPSPVLYPVSEEVRCLARFTHCEPLPTIVLPTNLSNTSCPSSTHDEPATPKLGHHCLFCVTRWDRRYNVRLPSSSSKSLLVGHLHDLPMGALVFALYTTMLNAPRWPRADCLCHLKRNQAYQSSATVARYACLVFAASGPTALHGQHRSTSASPRLP